MRAQSLVLVSAVLVGSAQPGLGQARASVALGVDGPEWRLSAAPVFRVGDGADTRALFTLITDATRLPDRRIAVLENIHPEVRVFSPTGELVTTFGRSGVGPGEFRSPFKMTRSATGELMVWDPPRRSVVRFGDDGAHIRTDRHVNDPESPHNGQLLSDGSRVLRRWHPERTERGETYKGRHTLLRATDDEFHEFQVVSGQELYSSRLGTPVGLPLAPEDLYAAGGPERVVVVGNTGTGELTIYGSEGHVLRALIRDDRRELSRQQRERIVGESKDQVAFDPDAQSYLDRYTAPERAPAFIDLLVDELGMIWLEDWRFRDEPRRVVVITPAGEVQGVVRLPNGLRVLEAGANYLLGVWEDELGVQQAVMYDLHRCVSPER